MARGELPAARAHLVAPVWLLSPQPGWDAPCASDTAPLPRDAGVQPHLSPHPPLPPPSQEPLGWPNSPSVGSMERSSPPCAGAGGDLERGLRHSRCFSKCRGSRHRSPGHQASPDSPPRSGGGYRACGLTLARLRVWAHGALAGERDRRGAESPRAPPCRPRGWRQSAAGRVR